MKSKLNRHRNESDVFLYQYSNHSKTFFKYFYFGRNGVLKKFFKTEFYGCLECGFMLNHPIASHCLSFTPTTRHRLNCKMN